MQDVCNYFASTENGKIISNQKTLSVEGAGGMWARFYFQTCCVQFFFLGQKAIKPKPAFRLLLLGPKLWIRIRTWRRCTELPFLVFCRGCVERIVLFPDCRQFLYLRFHYFSFWRETFNLQQRQAKALISFGLFGWYSEVFINEGTWRVGG